MQKEIISIINSIEKDNFSINADELLAISRQLTSDKYSDEVIHSFLELSHFPQVNYLFSYTEHQEEWLNLLCDLVDRSNFHTGYLIKQRAERYSDKTLYQVINGNNVKSVSYSEALIIINDMAKSLTELIKNSSNPVIGIFSPNSLDTALLDLTCLSFNVKIVPIPANTSIEHLKYIIKHSELSHLFVNGTEQFKSIQSISSEIENIELISFLNTNINTDTTLWSDFLLLGQYVSDDSLIDRMQSTRMDEDATIMYTSGTTANPKGIIFTQTNIITKRFARALALPDVNSDDSFLCYLPLYHTFGRYLELMGSIFWGATYTFAESPSFKSLIENMQLVNPSIFISIPKRWLQLYELLISESASNDETFDKIISDKTGGNLRLGLSAAGYLDPDIFIFFHKNNIQLLSGYGMTEATGGITMTPQNDYMKDSVGKPLPGIELKLGKENELLLKGSYITKYYHDQKKESTLKKGWFHTGDIFEKRNEHYFIIDRIKEIYKNSRGLTISPQKIENLFQDFDAIKSVFLVGDRKPYNTILIYPDKKWLRNLKSDNDFDKDEYFNSLIQSVNSFLAPFERIVNYNLIDRDFSTIKGELTPKKTYKRKNILKNFAKFISPMYEKDYESFLHDGYELRISKWLLRKSDLLGNYILWNGNKLKIRNTYKYLTVKIDDTSATVGDFKYINSSNILNLKEVVKSHELWLGNSTFVDFFGITSLLSKSSETSTEMRINLKSIKFDQKIIEVSLIENIKHAIREKLFDLEMLHRSVIIIFNGRGQDISIAINYLSKILTSDKTELIELAIESLKKLRFHPQFKIRVKALEVLTPYISGELFIELLTEIYCESENPKMLQDLTLDTRVLKVSHFRSILDKLSHLRYSNDEYDEHSITFIEALLNTITLFAIKHPTEYKWARSELVKWNLMTISDYLTDITNNSLINLISGFREWLGENRINAIDSETGEQYTWQDVIVFDPNIDNKFKENIFNAIANTALLKEAIFLLSKFKIVELDDIQKRGVWIMFLGSNHGKSVFRVTVQTRDHNTYNFVINNNDDLSREQIINETKWLITTGSSTRGQKLIEDFGGHWKDYKVFTEEYVQGETLYQYLERNSNLIESSENTDLWQLRWMHFIWNGIMAYFSFYRRTNFSLYIKNSSINSLIIPEQDYAIGTRLVSISDKATLENKIHLFSSLYENFILNTEKEYDGLPHIADWEIIFCALLQTVTVNKGIEILNELANEIGNSKLHGLSKNRINKFISEINEDGLLTKQVVFASLRYERWLALNKDATIEARNSMIRQLYTDYNLNRIIDDYPETRLRYFLMTVFKDSNESLKNELLNVQKRLRAKTITADDLESHINSINKNVKLNEDDKYFLTRLLFEHIDTDEQGKEFVWESDSDGKIELITAITDNFGDNHQIRRPAHPKEIVKFQTLLLNSNLSAIFNQQNEFLLIFNSNTQLIGGVFWKKIDEKTTYLERIVIHPKYRKRHLSSMLLDELFNRLKNKRYSNISVGFFQAGLFYNKGFIIDKQFGGLVKKLD